MKTYWDLAESERAALTRDDVAKFIDAELMLKGVLKPRALVLLRVAEPSVAKQLVYRIGHDHYHRTDIAFERVEDAMAVLAMRPLIVCTEWANGTTRECTKQLASDAAIVPIELPRQTDVALIKGELKEIDAAKAENERRRTDHAEDERKVEEALAGLWEDWHACVARDAEMRRVAETFAEYVATAGDSEEGRAIASKFLRKAFAHSVICEAEAWTGRRMTYEPLDQAQTAAASSEAQS